MDRTREEDLLKRETENANLSGTSEAGAVGAETGVTAPADGADETEAEPVGAESTAALHRKAIRLSWPVKIACAAVILLALSGFATQLMRYNAIRAKTEAVRKEISAYELQIARMQYLIGAPLDENYIRQTAREKLGLHYPDEILYYNDLHDPQK